MIKVKEKLMSRKFWVTVFSNIISIIAIFSDIGGNVGTILGIVGTVLSSVTYMLMEGIIDKERLKTDHEDIKVMIESIKKKGE